MAKMFYTLDEAKVALSKNEEEIKQFAREGRLREFRDGPRLMFKADQVEQLRSQLGGGDISAPPPTDSGAPIGLADSKGGSSIGIPMADASAAGMSGSLALGEAAGTTPGSGMMNLKEDTALAADLGLSGSVGGVPSPSRGAGGSAASLTGTGTGSRVGINIFGDETPERADPGAQTAIASKTPDQINLDSVGSGSGLLDLTRESDDTSLGAELLEEVSPGAKRGAAPASPGKPARAARELESPGGSVVRSVGGVVPIERPDPLAPAFGAAALGAAAVLCFGIFALVASVSGTTPDILRTLADKSIWIIFGAGAVVTVVLFVIGLVAGKAMS